MNCLHALQGHSWNWRTGLLYPPIDIFLHRGAVVRSFSIWWLSSVCCLLAFYRYSLSIYIMKLYNYLLTLVVLYWITLACLHIWICRFLWQVICPMLERQSSFYCFLGCMHTTVLSKCPVNSSGHVQLFWVQTIWWGLGKLVNIIYRLDLNFTGILLSRYKWNHSELSLDKRLDFFESNWAFFAGFGNLCTFSCLNYDNKFAIC